MLILRFVYRDVEGLDSSCEQRNPGSPEMRRGVEKFCETAYLGIRLVAVLAVEFRD